jgi:hypothetical protein
MHSNSAPEETSDVSSCGVGTEDGKDVDVCQSMQSSSEAFRHVPQLKQTVRRTKFHVLQRTHNQSLTVKKKKNYYLKLLYDN